MHFAKRQIAARRIYSESAAETCYRGTKLGLTLFTGKLAVV